ncbi:MAG: fructosamine kinase family protein [Gammaproteobacteria bacterium]
MDIWPIIADDIARSTGKPFRIERYESVAGGSINTAWRISNHEQQRYFVKTNRAERAAMFEAEAEGLREIADTGTIRVPRPICHGVAANQAYLVQEYVSFDGHEYAVRFGEQLAAMHRHTAQRFGWHRDNTIGSTTQVNTWSDEWVAFWRAHRLGFQLQLAESRGASARLIERGLRLTEGLAAFFTTYQPVPSLLHGDLWSGNFDTDSEGNPVIFDPAVYYGDRETDIAMTELFGGPGPAFYSAYHGVWALDGGYAVRRELYNLYHILNHFNLFGGGYAGQAERMIDRLLAELG